MENLGEQRCLGHREAAREVRPDRPPIRDDRSQLEILDWLRLTVSFGGLRVRKEFGIRKRPQEPDQCTSGIPEPLNDHRNSH